MHGVMGQIEKEWLANFHRIGDVRFGFAGERVGEKRAGKHPCMNKLV